MMMVRDANWKLAYDAEQGGVQYLFNLRRDPEELDNLAGVAGYEHVEKHYVELLLTRLIRLTHHTQQKERERLQRVRA
jgi:arylsulfatase A-like enzyme